MAERAAWLVERVVPHVATRQWVLTVPWKRRWLLARNPDLALGVLRIAIARVERWWHDVEAPVEEIWRAAERWLRRQGHAADDDTDPDAEDASALLQPGGARRDWAVAR